MKILVIVSLVFWSSLTLADVEVTIAGQTYKYTASPRVTEVLAPIIEEQDWYWASASVFNLDSKESDSNRQKVVEQLTMLGQQDSSNQSSYQKIIDQLKSWQLATRINIKIDYELARIQKSKNPAFEDGRYLIDLTTRPKSVSVEGAIAVNAKLNFSENTCLSDYLAKISILDIASKDFVYLVQPDGRTRAVGVAYWNSKCVLVMPGTQIYVPLAESPIFSDAATLNQVMVKILANRILNK